MAHDWLLPFRDLNRRVMNAIARAVVTAVNDDGKLQVVQVGILADEVKDKIERLQAYGFTSHPLPGAEAAVIFIGGNRDHGLVISIDDRRYRLQGLAPGEVALYTDEDSEDAKHRVILRRGRLVEVHGTDILLKADSTLRLQGRNVEVHAVDKWQWDVRGYGEQIFYAAPNTWRIETWKQGAIMEPDPVHGVSEPAIPSALD